MKRKFLCFILIISMTVAAFSTYVLASIPPPSQYNVIFDGEPLRLNMPILNREGRLAYPFRELFEALGATVEWDDATRTIDIVEGKQ